MNGRVLRKRDSAALDGLSLAEVVLSIGLLTIVAVTIAGVFTHLLNASAKASDLSAGRLLAQQVLDRAVRTGPPDWGVPSGSGSKMLNTHQSDLQTEFFYTVTPALLSQDTGMAGVSREFYFIEVEVTWWGTDPTKSRPEMGRLSTSVSQTAGYER